MEKYLFTDGTNEIREVESAQELQSLIQSTVEPSKARIWIFSTSEWLSISDFNKRSSRQISFNKKSVFVAEPKEMIKPQHRSPIPGLLKKISIGVVTAAAIFLIYNFTRVTWRKASALSIVAERPLNSPAMNIDSVIGTIESLRGQKLDKITRTNLRIRNTWPDLVQLQLTANRDTSREGLRYHDLEFLIDNSTGYNIDNAVVQLSVWNNGEAVTDTLHFEDIGYATPARKKIETPYRGDSLSVSFISIRAKAFNFCYSSDKKSNYGNYNDRWYCR